MGWFARVNEAACNAAGGRGAWQALECRGIKDVELIERAAAKVGLQVKAD